MPLIVRNWRCSTTTITNGRQKIISEGGFESVGDKVSIVVKQPNCLASTIEECPLPGFIVWG
jgi:hypothetical protein